MQRKTALTSWEYWQKATHFIIKQYQHPLPEDDQHLNKKDKSGVARQVARMEHMGNLGNHLALLNKHSSLVPLLVLHNHIRAFHAGPSITFSKFRKRYWLKEQYLAFYIRIKIANDREHILFHYQNFCPSQWRESLDHKRFSIPEWTTLDPCWSERRCSRKNMDPIPYMFRN